jgi:hypothetical protein
MSEIGAVLRELWLFLVQQLVEWQWQWQCGSGAVWLCGSGSGGCRLLFE